MPGLEGLRNTIGTKLHIEKPFIRNFLAEFLGTAFLVALGCGAVAQVVLSKKIHPWNQLGDFFSINVAFAFAIAFGIFIAGNVSGGHINPAVTLVMCVLGKTPWVMLPIYWLGQYLGAFFGAVIVFWVYHASIHSLDHGIRYTEGQNATAGIFATYPAGPHVTSWDGFVDQMVGTAILLLVVLALTDTRNLLIPSYFTPVIIGFTVGLIGMSFGYNAGFALNPARDLGPRIFTAVAGWGGQPFSFRNYDWFWVPIIGPHVGAFVGMAFYKLFIGLHWPKRVEITEVHHEEEQVRLTKA
jgi:MIP family channel proteins